MERNSDPTVRRCQRVLMMVHELHKIGYQRLRIAPGMSASGMHWRCSVTHVANTLQSHGALLCKPDLETVHYSSADENYYFGWEDARQDTARQLADKFVVRFGEVAQLGLGEDWVYAGWYVQMLGLAEKGVFPVAYADWYEEPDPRWLPTTVGFKSGLPMPPAGQG